MRTTLVTSFILLSCPVFFSQNSSFLRDSIMSIYMENGYANTHFIPKGKMDKNELRQGKWENYEIEFDHEFISVDGKPKDEAGYYLLYGKGKFDNGKKVGKWKFFVVEDKSFKKILQKELSYKNNQKEGAFTYYYPSGKIAESGHFVAGQYEGEAKMYYEDGSIYELSTYSNSNRSGKQLVYHQNGSVSIERYYKDDSLNGPSKSFYSSGILQQSCSYNMDLVNGVFSYFHENGQLWIEKEYQNGLLMNVTANFDKTGKARDKGSLINGNGTLILYTHQDEIYNIENYQNGKLISETKTSEPQFIEH